MIAKTYRMFELIEPYYENFAYTMQRKNLMYFSLYHPKAV
jgi:hypothetical protein